MFKLRDEDRAPFAADVVEAAQQTDLLAAVGALYAAFEAEREWRAPRCDASGKCCHFDAYGHQLFVTTAELAAFVASVPGDRDESSNAGGCRYQVEGLCTARQARPFGCRVYFCDPTSNDWQHEQYERFQTAIRELHERFGVQYWYVEWRDALAAVGLTSANLKAVSNARVVLTVVPARR